MKNRLRNTLVLSIPALTTICSVVYIFLALNGSSINNNLNDSGNQVTVQTELFEQKKEPNL